MRPYTYTYNVMCVYKPAASCSDQGAAAATPPGGHAGHLAPRKSRNGYHCPPGHRPPGIDPEPGTQRPPGCPNRPPAALDHDAPAAAPPWAATCSNQGAAAATPPEAIPATWRRERAGTATGGPGPLITFCIGAKCCRLHTQNPGRIA